MKLRTVVRNCLFLNWALPLEELPALPQPLRYERHDWQGRSYAFASALLFRQHGVRLAGLPFLGLSHPQLNFRFYVLDGEGVPSVLFRRMLVPAWVVPGGWLARQPLRPARMRFPASAAFEAEEAWRWTVQRRGTLSVEARRGAPPVGEGPRFSSWEASVSYFRHRPRGYSAGSGGLRRIETSHPRVTVWPLAARVEEAGLLARCVPADPWPELHSAFLCPEIPFLFELAAVPEVAQLARPAVPVVPGPAMFSRRPHRPPTRAAA